MVSWEWDGWVVGEVVSCSWVVGGVVGKVESIGCGGSCCCVVRFVGWLVWWYVVVG